MNAHLVKARILEILRAEPVAVSGERLSAGLDVSRVSVWKHIQKLKELGYNIRSSRKGYRLLASPDALLPWEFPGREDRVHYFPRIESTMDVAKQMAAKGCPHMTLIVASEQSRGRGRLKRRWESDAGGLYFTLVLRPRIPPVECPKLNFLASLVLAQTLGRKYGIEARLKWPNDILVQGKKIVGMLIEMEAEADRVHYVNIGLGINVNNNPIQKTGTATSIRQILGKTVHKKPLLTDFLDAFEQRLEEEELDDVLSDWKKWSVTLHRHVRVETLNDVTEGIAEDVDENGGLVVRQPDGSQKTVYYGDCFHT